MTLKTKMEVESIVTTLAAFGDDCFLAGCADGLIVLLSFEGKQFSFEGHTHAVTGVSKVNDFQFVSCALDFSACLWDVDSSRPVNKFSQLEFDCLTGIIFLEGSLVAIGGDELNFWEFHTEEVNKVLSVEAGVKAIAKNEDILVAGSGNGCLVVVDWRKQVKLGLVEAHTGQVTSIVSLDETTVASGGADFTLVISDVKNFSVLFRINKEATILPILKVNMTKFIFSSENSISIYDWKINVIIKSIEDEGTVPVSNGAIVGQKIIASGKTHSIFVWDLVK